MYFIKFKKTLNLNKPKSFNEKLQWRKLNLESELFNIIADKIKVREYVKEKIGENYLIPLIGVYESTSQVNIDKLPTQFVLKTNHLSGGVNIILNKSNWDTRKSFYDINNQLKRNHYTLTKEPQYKFIKPLIIIEEFMWEEKDKVPMDYKIHCFDGKALLIQIDVDRFGNHKRSLFSSKWEKLPIYFGPLQKGKPIYEDAGIIEEPKKLQELISVSETLAKDFDYIRVDLYVINNKIYFGELTLHHGSGWEGFYPDKYDMIFGEMIMPK